MHPMPWPLGGAIMCPSWVSVDLINYPYKIGDNTLYEVSMKRVSLIFSWLHKCLHINDVESRCVMPQITKMVQNFQTKLIQNSTTPAIWIHANITQITWFLLLHIRNITTSIISCSLSITMVCWYFMMFVKKVLNIICVTAHHIRKHVLDISLLDKNITSNEHALSSTCKPYINEQYTIRHLQLNENE